MRTAVFDAHASRQQVLAAITPDPATCHQLDTYVAHLHAWRGRINLIAQAEFPRLWQRHILDSAQLLTPLLAHLKNIPSQNTPAKNPSTKNPIVLDIGSGGGFPAIVLAILAPKINFILVESDGRKCGFLESAIGACNLKNCQTINARVEHLPAMHPQPQVITARAVASLTQLLKWTHPFHHPRLLCLFMKGGQVKKELDALTALTRHNNYSTLQTTLLPSITHPDGCIVQCSGFKPAPAPATTAKNRQAHD